MTQRKARCLPFSQSEPNGVHDYGKKTPARKGFFAVRPGPHGTARRYLALIERTKRSWSKPAVNFVDVSPEKASTKLHSLLPPGSS